MRQGDFVTRKSYGGDVMFKIERIEQLKAILRGVDYRLLADAPLVDLTISNPTDVMDHPRSSSPRISGITPASGGIPGAAAGEEPTLYKP
ncbi:hypothetical protein QFZ80_006695 [Paenibacillus sp. V4I7]|nr:sporulation peptidase YabG [Paenibacillus sp. V4I7]MDQ0902867.1 hypothetical protein [Paenibacillus sp. V4I7]